MSDRVRYLAGNTIGRDHPQWPNVLLSELPTLFPGITADEIDQTWPADVTLAQEMALCWRVKKWRLTGSFEVTINYFDPSGPTQTIIGSGEGEFAADTFLSVLSEDLILGEIEAVTESDLVKTQFGAAPYAPLVNNGTGHLVDNSPVLDWEIDFSTPAASTSGSTPPSGAGALTIKFLGGFHLFDTGTSLFSPIFTSGLGNVIDVPQGGGFTPGLLVNVRYNRNPQTVLSGTGPLLLKAPGTLTIKPLITADIAVPLEISWRLPAEAVGSVISGTASGDFVLEAEEFWTYENSLGQPVWNSVTGEPINGGPFS